MTSANVYYLDFNDPEGKLLHRHRQNIRCKEHYDWDKILSLDPETTTVKTWGYDEEEDYWDNDDDYYNDEVEVSLPVLKDWLKSKKILNRELREKINGE